MSEIAWGMDEVEKLQQDMAIFMRSFDLKEVRVTRVEGDDRAWHWSVTTAGAAPEKGVA